MGLSRSEQMRRIRGANTSPEVALRCALADHEALCSPREIAPVGRPDLVFLQGRVAVFVDGCFWHGCPLHYARPRTREQFWASKLIGNLIRDARQSTTLQETAWKVVRVWEHEVVEDVTRAAADIERVLRGEAPPTWADQRRVRRVVDLGGSVERRDVVLLGMPDEVIEVTEGPRVTAKARIRR